MTADYVVVTSARCFRCGTNLTRSFVDLHPGGVLVNSLVKRHCSRCGLDFHTAASIEQLGALRAATASNDLSDRGDD